MIEVIVRNYEPAWVRYMLLYRIDESHMREQGFDPVSDDDVRDYVAGGPSDAVEWKILSGPDVVEQIGSMDQDFEVQEINRRTLFQR